MNRSTYKYTKQGDFTDTIKNQFPIIENISITKPETKNTILAEISYKTPDLALTHGTSTRVASENYSYKVTATDSIQE